MSREDENYSLVSIDDYAAHGHWDSVFRLLDLGEDVNSLGSNGETLLFAAVRQLDSNSAAELLKRGADPNYAIRIGGWGRNNSNVGQTPLHFAVTFNNAELVRLLIEFGADIHAQNSNGLSPLACAEAKNYTELVSILKNRK